ncbi:hypothetical protein [Hymenobacter sp. B81]|uniref:hypothetical protein n=1 Tax=Hymenobacter sp. B81 TaxID=3344878 RepID=UPI0037DCF553
MAFDVNKLQTRAQCLEAKEKLEAELRGYQNRDQNQEYRDWRGDRAETTTAQLLARATERVAYLTGQLAKPDLSANDRLRAEDELEVAEFQQKRLTRRATNAGGVIDFLADVDADQVDAQVALLTQAITAVQQRHDALPA